jgi:hypothetical protein
MEATMEGHPAELERTARDRRRGAGLVRARRPVRLVLVRWRDAWFDFERDPSGWRDEYLVQTVGFLVREEPGVVSLAQERLPGRDGYRAITHIPRGVIESITPVAEEEIPARRAEDRTPPNDA